MEITTVGHAGQPFFSRARLQPDRVQQVVMPNGVASATGSQFACQDQATASMRRLSGPGPFDRREPGAVRADFLVVDAVPGNWSPATKFAAYRQNNREFLNFWPHSAKSKA
jgi:hypothetical protein